MKRKLWSTISNQTSTKQITSSHLKSLNTERDHDIHVILKQRLVKHPGSVNNTLKITSICDKFKTYIYISRLFKLWM
jgi:hypothetical protein